MIAKKRVVRKRPTATASLEPLSTEFEIKFKLLVGKPGITEEEAKGYVVECMRYSSAAHIFYIPHPIGGSDVHKRKGHCPFKGVEDIKVKATT